MMTFMIIITAIMATCLTYFICFNLNKGPVLASAIVTLISGLLLPYFFSTGGSLLAGVATCGSYAAMVSKAKFPRFTDMVFVGIICGIVFALTQDVFIGVGGKLGSIAAISGFTWLGIRRVMKHINIKKSTR
ncbi:MAG: hypothetical protein GX053_01530 [Tissierella sp.]|nr:hypothetical protein [Tissierella sp.]